MSDVDHLGELEQLVLLAVARLGGTAYGVEIRREIERRAGRALSIGAVYATLDRLERRGFASSREGEPTAVRGGRAKRYFRVEPAGAAALRGSRAALERMWEGLDLDPRPGAACPPRASPSGSSPSSSPSATGRPSSATWPRSTPSAPPPTPPRPTAGTSDRRSPRRSRR